MNHAAPPSEYAAKPAAPCTRAAVLSAVPVSASMGRYITPGTFVIACDEIYTTRELVKSGIIDFVICQDSKTQGYQAIKKLHEYLIRTENETMDDYIVDNIIKIKNHFEIN